MWKRFSPSYNTGMRFCFLSALILTASLLAAAEAKLDYRVLATSKTSTMEKELNAAAAEG